jgi:hypothetical protein
MALYQKTDRAQGTGPRAVNLQLWAMGGAFILKNYPKLGAMAVNPAQDTLHS